MRHYTSINRRFIYKKNRSSDDVDISQIGNASPVLVGLVTGYPYLCPMFGCADFFVFCADKYWNEHLVSSVETELRQYTLSYANFGSLRLSNAVTPNSGPGR